jgi:hypothetical protein
MPFVGMKLGFEVMTAECATTEMMDSTINNNVIFLLQARGFEENV